MSTIFKIHPILLVTNALGSIILVIGLYEWFIYKMFVPEIYQFENYEIALVIIGVMLSLPGIIARIKLIFLDKDDRYKRKY